MPHRLHPGYGGGTSETSSPGEGMEGEKQVPLLWKELGSDVTWHKSYVIVTALGAVHYTSWGA